MKKRYKNIETTDVRDGLFPSLRYALAQLKRMNDENNGKYRKSKRVVDKVVSDFNVNPEDLYDSLINATYPRCNFELVDGHGNVGFPPAEMNFTEMKVSSLYRRITDIYNNDDFDAPLYTPLPLVLINGTLSSGNNVTLIPSHNIGEVIDATIALIKDPDLETKDLMKYIKGPDILVGGQIIDCEQLYKIYENGYGVIEIKIDHKTVNKRIWGDVSDFCRWYNFKLRKRLLKKEYKILIKYQAKLFDGKTVQYMSLKHILQNYIEYSKSVFDMTDDLFCQKLENLKEFSKDRITRIQD